GLNSEPPMWVATFESLLHGKARRIFQNIQITHNLFTFQDIAIEVGNRLCPPPNEVTIELRLESLHWNGRKEHMESLAAEINELFRLQYPGKEQSLVLISQAAKKFLRLMPLKWADQIKQASTVETIDGYLYVAQQLFDREAAKWQQKRAWQVSQHLPTVVDDKGKLQLQMDPFSGKAINSKKFEKQLEELKEKVKSGDDLNDPKTSR
ncbi:MAG: hypothetical protein GY738_03240, partial [Pseudoalteromonas sp.]|nr:hypothetical protein [Pseudoalteromonas sp.]